MSKLLIVNPNSSQSMTEEIKTSLTPSVLKKPSLSIEYFSAPPSAPSEIIDVVTSAESCREFAELNQYIDRNIRLPNKKIVIQGIFDSSLIFAVSKFPREFLILTSNDDWVSILNESVQQYFGGVDIPFFKGTYSSGITPKRIHDKDNFVKLIDRIEKLIEQNPEVKVILLGCAGFSGMESRFAEYFTHVIFVDPVKTGFNLINAFG
ncbi:Dcg1 protein [Saccharomycopsis crataegensis]|uniref:Dcg1 protein n=1 Tax=Saccharomycopsis crataegensis TaxID=43959 RepID=A0AAV5QLD4_9ASCO|nr:Dcg1 protein [Saccharomycopsis crataegensis]